MSPPGLAPRPLERLTGLLHGGGWRRALLVRRVVAALLVLLALVLALRPAAGSARAALVVAAADLPAGATVRPEDVAVRRWPAELVPAGALSDPASVAGRVLVGAARAGEPLTDVRLVGAGPRPGPDAAAVPVRLADAAVATLLVPGTRVDVVAPGEHADRPVLLAAGAEVLAVLADDSRTRGRLVLVSLPPDTATRVAAAALAQEVAVTLR